MCEEKGDSMNSVGCMAECPGVTWGRKPRGLCPVTNREGESGRNHSWFLSPQNKGEFRHLSLQLSCCELVPEDALGPNTHLIFHRKRLKAKNLMYIKQILYLLEQFVAVLGGKQTYCISRGADRLRARWCFLRTLSPFPLCRICGLVLLVYRFRWH